MRTNCKCPVCEDFRDFIFWEALYTTLPEDFANCVHVAITQQLMCTYQAMCLVAVALENTPDVIMYYRHVYTLST